MQLLENKNINIDQRYSLKLSKDTTPIYMTNEAGKRLLNELMSEGRAIEEIRQTEYSKLYIIK